MTVPDQQWRAWPLDADPASLARANHQARDDFLASGQIVTGMRSVVADSWRRCVRNGLDPDGGNQSADIADDELGTYRSAHPLAAVMPVIRRLLVEDAVDADLIVAVSDAAGRLLWVEGARGLRGLAAGMNFVPGAVWSEAAAGTNAPGTALALDHALQIFGAEHLLGPATPWSCTAAPIHAPDGAVLGALDLTGGADVAAPHTLRLVSAVAAAVEAELRAQPVRRPETTPRLAVLGRAHGELDVGGVRRQLRQRHSELLLVLSEHPAGLTAEQLEAALHEGPAALVTARAEISRVRSLLSSTGGTSIGSRPYRLSPPLRTDAGEVRDLLRRGRFEAALARYPGPLLPGSNAPAVVRIRDGLHRDLRNAVIAYGEPELLWTFAHRPENERDADLWRACLRAQPAESPRRLVAVGRAIQLDREFGR